MTQKISGWAYLSHQTVSEFQVRKILNRAEVSIAPDQVVARVFYLVSHFEGLQTSELEALLGVMPADQLALEQLAASNSALVWVMPREGTVSPWSSKVADIVKRCGLQGVGRIEEGRLWQFSDPAIQQQVLPHLFDRMTEAALPSLQACWQVMHHAVKVQPATCIPVCTQGLAALQACNESLGLALSSAELSYLLHLHCTQLKRDPSEAELMMFAQANSEHCRHKVFNASWKIDGRLQPLSLFKMIANTHQVSPQHTVVAYRDNAAIVGAADVEAFYPDEAGVYQQKQLSQHDVIKVETHNHPTAISPYPGAATGVGGEIRDEAATGRGAVSRAGLCGFSVSNLGLDQQSEQPPSHLAPALQIMIEAPVGAAAFGNEFGRPNLAGYFRTYEHMDGQQHWGYHKPIMLAGGVGSIDARHTQKQALPPGSLLIQLGGPGFLIGLGGGAASSEAAGQRASELDFSSVQRANPQLQRCAQEVISRCCEQGENNPILSIHDVGAGGLSNALPELVHESQRGAQIQLEAIPVGQSGMNAAQIWCNEAQERFVLVIAAEQMAFFERVCRRESCPFAVLGTVTAQQDLWVESEHGPDPVHLPLAALLGDDIPRSEQSAQSQSLLLAALDLSEVELESVLESVLRLPVVASKSFLITIADRSVGGLTARDPCVGPWQVPVADCAAVLHDHFGLQGSVFTVAERAPIALVDATAAARLTVGEALTNLLAAGIADLSTVKLSANWMASVADEAERLKLFKAVQAIGMSLCPELSISIPVGKDSLFMRTHCPVDESGQAWQVQSPVSLVISAFSQSEDVSAVMTPDLASDVDTELLLIDLGQGNNRLGASALAQVIGQVGDCVPDLSDSQALISLQRSIYALHQAGLILAYHDRSDGGLWACLCEMAFAAHCGLDLNLDTLCYDAQLGDVDWVGVRQDVLPQRHHESTLKALFCEELGVVIQIQRKYRQQVMAVLRENHLSRHSHVVARVNEDDTIRIWRDAKLLYQQSRAHLQQVWSQTSFSIQRLRDCAHCAEQEHAAHLDTSDGGLSMQVPFKLTPWVAKSGALPKVAVLREQGSNGQSEMAAALHLAGFEAVDVSMQVLLAGEVGLDDLQGLAVCGGFSYGDVLGAGVGWAQSILLTPKLREAFLRFFHREDSFSFGVCNGCQMLSHLKTLIPGASHWPRFMRNRSEQYEARLVSVKVRETPSVLFDSMQGAYLPVVVSHAEGRAVFDQQPNAKDYISLQYVNAQQEVAACYPANPNGSDLAAAAITSLDGRATIMMPHPERVFRTVQLSWCAQQWKKQYPEFSPWMQMFYNLRRYIA